MNIDADGENELPEEDNKGVEDGLLGEMQNELKINTAGQVDRRGGSSGLQGTSIVQVQPQPQPQGTVVCWERFLHVRSIRVLLVENDDSTRHVVTALLRNCNYEVLETGNGIQAWKILEDLNNHVDIVLTEVVMPCVSGISLLLKIMSHKTRKNIPVIMMSSHDSMGVVFKCLSKGAVDFLVKPIRKNELKNLWQHVWRRCHSSSGSGSESGTQTQKSVKSKGNEKSSNSASDDEENVGVGSDDGSGAQSSWTKQAVEADSTQALSPMDQVAECQDSTCAQVIRSNAEHCYNEKMPMNASRDGHELKKSDTVEKGKDLESVVDRSVEPKSENLIDVQPNLSGRASESPKDIVNKLDSNSNAADECKEPNLELSLKRLRGVEDTVRSVQDDRYVLRRSEQSAFSRYNTSTNIFRAPNVITGSNSLLDNSIEVAKRESDVQVYSTGHFIYQSSNGVSNNIDMGSTTNKLFKDKSEATSSMNGAYPSAFGPVKTDINYSQQQSSLQQRDTQSTDLCPVRGSYQELQMQHPHLQNYHQQQHHHPDHFHRAENQPSSNHDESSLKKMAADAPHCGSSNVLGRPVDGHLRNYSLNRSASGSNYGSNGQNGSSTAINTIGQKGESDIGQAGKSGSGSGSGGDASGSGSGNRVDKSIFAQREAVLIKFRQKRKKDALIKGWNHSLSWKAEYHKLVRYQNRKKLAEQRPRVRGQFVKQLGTDGSSRDEDV